MSTQRPKTRKLTAVAVNLAATTVSPNFEKFAQPRGISAKRSPIDGYYAEAERLLLLSREPWCNERLLSLLLIDLVSAVELYVRDLIVGLVATCPGASSASARKQVSLASLKYYPEPERVYAVFDHQALSGSGEICKTTFSILDIEIKQNSDAHAALSVFDRVCHLRHAIVHQGGRLAPHNLLEQKLRSMPLSPVNVRLTVLLFEELLAVCHSAVRAYNQNIFEQTLERWVANDVLTLRWADDRLLFESVIPLFHSTTDVPTLSIQGIYLSMGGSV